MVIINKTEKKSRTLKGLRQGEIFKFKNGPLAEYGHLFLFFRTGMLFNLTTNTDYCYNAWEISEDNISDDEVIVYSAEIHLLDHD